MEKQLKPKVHAVVVEGKTTLVMARTKQGAITAVIEARIEKMRSDATVEIATGEQLYHAGMAGQAVLHGEQFAPTSPTSDDMKGPAQIDAFAAGTAFDPAHPDNAAWKAQGDYAGTIAAPDTRVVVEAKHPEAIGS